MKIPVLTLLGICAPMACVRGCCFGAAPLPPGPGRGCRDEKKKNVPVRKSFIFVNTAQNQYTFCFEEHIEGNVFGYGAGNWCGIFFLLDEDNWRCLVTTTLRFRCGGISFYFISCRHSRLKHRPVRSRFFVFVEAPFTPTPRIPTTPISYMQESNQYSAISDIFIWNTLYDSRWLLMIRDNLMISMDTCSGCGIDKMDNIQRNGQKTLQSTI